MSLKDHLASGPLDFAFLDRSPAKQSVSKAGKEYTYWEYTLKNRTTGDSSIERLFQWDHQKCANVQPGQLIRASLNDKGYPTFTPVPTGEASMYAQPESNYKAVEREREASNACRAEWKFCTCERCETKRKEDEERWAKNNVSIILGMLVKEHMRSGRDFSSALMDAKKDRLTFNKVVDDIYRAEKAGVDLSHEALSVFPDPQ